jgi:hypothetical protein
VATARRPSCGPRRRCARTRHSPTRSSSSTSSAARRDILQVRWRTSLSETARRDETNRITATQRTFLANLLSFILDSSASGDTRLIAKQALRDSVQSLLLTSDAGFPTFKERWLAHPHCSGSFTYEAGCAIAHGITFPRYSLLPELAVRWELGDYWIDRSDDGIRRTLSADALAINVPIRNYLGVRASVVDLAAPFTEIALRQGGMQRDNQKYIALELFRPRLDVWLGMPRLTRRVAFVAGVAASVVTRTVNTDDSGEMSLHYDHVSSVDDVQWSFNLGAMVFL